MALDGISRLPHQDLLDFGRLAELLGYDRKVNTLDYPVSPRGYRILGRIPRLPKLVVQNIVREFRGLDKILAATDPELESVEGVGEIRAKDIREGLRRCRRSTSWTATCKREPAGRSGSRTMTKEDTIPDTALEIEDLEIEREIVNIDFEIGDNVVYPHQGPAASSRRKRRTSSARSASTSRSRSS